LRIIDNRISELKGLEGLVSLTSLNISYNEGITLTDIEGFKKKNKDVDVTEYGLKGR
jgi:Leucine-rich repeat (LRR) protein